MKHRKLTLLLTAASLGLSSGCAMDGMRSALSRSTAMFRRTPDSGEDSSIAGSRSRLRGGSSKDEELSEEFKEAQKTFKHTEQTMLAWARYQEDVGEFAEARKKYRELLIAYPENTEASLGMARIEMVTGRSQQAEEILTQLERKRPNDSLVKLELGRMYSQQERWADAMASFEKASELDPQDQTSRYELGVALTRAHRFDAALSHLTFAVGAPAANYNIGYILHEEGNDADAVEWFRNALNAHPDQQTADKTKAMLAKLAPADPLTRDVAAIAQSRAGHSGAASMAVSQAAAGRSVARFTPDTTGLNRSEASIPVVKSGRPTQIDVRPGTMTSQAAVQSPPVPYLSQDNSFQNVSYSDTVSGSSGVMNSAGEPPQWNGPSSSQASATVRPAALPQEPQRWRSQQN